MPLQICLTILICLILGVSGCMKAVAPKPAPPPVEPPPKVEPKTPYDSEIPAHYLDLLSRIPAPAGESVPLTCLAVADHFAAQGEDESALLFLDRAADGFVREKNGSGEAAARSRKAVLLSDSGRENEADEMIRGAGEAWKAPPLRAFSLYLEGHRALQRGDFPRALSALTRSLEDNANFREDFYLLKLRRDTELDAGIAMVLADGVPRLLAANGLNGTPSAVADPDAGADRLREALTLNRELYRNGIAPLLPEGDSGKTEAEAHNFLGLWTGMKGEWAEALRHLVQAGELSQKAGFPAGEIRSLLFRGELGLRGESGAEGLQAAELLRERADRRGVSPYRVWARLLLARYAEKEGRKPEAIRFLQEAAGVIEAERSPLMVEMVDEVCRGHRRSVYESLVELLAGEGMAAEALRAAEAGKSTLIVDLLNGQEIGRTDGERERLRQEALLGREIRGLQRRILQISDEAMAGGLLEQLKHAEEGYRELLGRIGAEDERLLSLIAVRGVEPAALQRLLDENTTLFDYFSTRNNLYVWAVHREQLHLERIGLTRVELRSFVLSFLAAIRDKDKRRTETLSRRAYNLLLQPIIPFVSGERIGFIPDDVLVNIPFAAMSYRGKFLAEGFTIFHLPAAALFRQVLGETGPAGLRILAFGNPDLENEALDLHFAVQEVERIRKRIGSTTVLLRQDASEAKAGEMLAGYDILHFAVRGQFFPEEILDSGLLLTPGGGQDGRLTVREIFRLRFQARAVVLSGCDPVPEKDPEGRGPISLQRAFLSAGSSSVISTLWLSDDKAVAHLLDLFYRQLGKKEPLADALRTAQLHLLREGYPPYVWAAFVLTGKY
jgi:CHAT domain-containing protein